eukprot:Blabericola_migrator_1__12974@NODE_860_length_6237_cov_124_199352_g610_i0_p5_GENE_NODE_860_length_6237_cov_124_199352_g610_i0NODE_860_length_6237_cov_124_199352_g610_i0_p5_ORF_typecomplete_len196_score29_40HOOK/PF05622_12/6_2e07HMMR_N/PF15905_5/1_5e05Myosin_tail_1/PF01576_19/3_4e05MAD/PF05557_13/8_4e05KASH_CCD/PF14662_6/0_0011HAP1_N/PF04849_13/0_0002DUF3584/PF12128_8/0_00035DUF812/PF05667_11/0_00036CALCOCO1/PF07888_11/0_00052Filament/PF00038_21/0_0011Leu_zip/PF15294_6/0_00057AIP3/PF03915_13/0_00
MSLTPLNSPLDSPVLRPYEPLAYEEAGIEWASNSHSTTSSDGSLLCSDLAGTSVLQNGPAPQKVRLGAQVAAVEHANDRLQLRVRQLKQCKTKFRKKVAELKKTCTQLLNTNRSLMEEQTTADSQLEMLRHNLEMSKAKCKTLEEQLEALRKSKLGVERALSQKATELNQRNRELQGLKATCSKAEDSNGEKADS